MYTRHHFQNHVPRNTQPFGFEFEWKLVESIWESFEQLWVVFAVKYEVTYTYTTKSIWVAHSLVSRVRLAKDIRIVWVKTWNDMRTTFQWKFRVLFMNLLIYEWSPKKNSSKSAIIFSSLYAQNVWNKKDILTTIEMEHSV